jgi:putative glutamine amidotransferase
VTTFERFHARRSDPFDADRPTTPLVAVLTGHFPVERASVHRTYLDAIWLAGGQPVVLSPPPPGALNSALDVIERCDALLVTGGGDVDPSRYGEPAEVPLMLVDSARDTFELAAVDRALAIGLPLLGICRGLQVLTVALGGRLYQDVQTAGFGNHWDEENAFTPVHGIRSAPGSLAARALAGRDQVNSVHHQAVADPGPHLTATAWSDDGLIEAVEAADGRPVLGLQWHPERLVCPPAPATGDHAHLAAFEWLVGLAVLVAANDAGNGQVHHLNGWAPATVRTEAGAVGAGNGQALAVGQGVRRGYWGG